MRRTHTVIKADGTTVRRKPVVGDLRWDGKRWRRWSGRRFTRAAYSLHPNRLSNPARFDDEPPIDKAQKQRALALAVEDQVVTNGATVVLDGPHGTVLAYRHKVSHFFHAIMTLVTGGLWAVVWLAIVFGRGQIRLRLEADDWGNVWTRVVAGT